MPSTQRLPASARESPKLKMAAYSRATATSGAAARSNKTANLILTVMARLLCRRRSWLVLSRRLSLFLILSLKCSIGRKVWSKQCALLECKSIFFVVLTRLFYRVLVTSSSTGEVVGG
jgi:hypothetical protein